MSERLSATVPENEAGERFDAVLARLFPQFSRSRLAEWVKQGRATLNGASVKPRAAVSPGDRIAVEVDLPVVVVDAPEAIPLTLLVEDPEFYIVDKPAGLVVHPGAGNRSGTLVNALLHRDPALSALQRAGVVHRLDKDTSGALLVARTAESHHALTKALAKRRIGREYLAVVQGKVIAGGTIEAPIGRHPHDRLKMAVVETGKPAVSHYRVVERFRAHTLLRVRLETGRTHQIRVHLAHLRWPILGDPLYGGALKMPAGASPELREALRGFRRQALHALELRLTHPRTGAEVLAQSPIPADLQALLDVLRADAAQAARG